MNRWLDTPLSKLPFVALDIETTGLRFSENHRIVEIGMVRYCEQGRTGQMSTLVNPEREIPEDAFRIHGISDVDVADAPTFEEIIPLIKAFLMDYPVLVYNENFDMGFINFQLKQSGYEPLANPVLDVLELARRVRVLNSERGYKLGNVARALKINYRPKRSHRALYDAYITAEVFRALTGEIARRGYHTLRDALIWLGHQHHHFSDILRAINKAIFEKGYLHIVYLTMHYERTERIIRPLSIENRNQEYFIRAYCFKSRDERVFRIRQIREWKFLTELPEDYKDLETPSDE